MKKVIKDSLFYAKILLFGEYGIIEDGMGLSIPYDSFNGRLEKGAMNATGNQKSNEHLRAFHQYLCELKTSGELLANLDLNEFRKDIASGWVFNSTIPQGFGIGSSGALVAAIYKRYSLEPVRITKEVDENQLLRLKEIFSQMESFFHGKSSGLDPLICYLKLPILIRSKSKIGTAHLPSSDQSGKGGIFLLNSGAAGETEPLVKLFMEKLKQEGFRNMIKTRFVKYNNACIEAFLQNDRSFLFKNLKQLSTLLLDYFLPMIPANFRELWKKGLESNLYYLKLCGSGGGGFVLGFTENLEQAELHLQPYTLKVIHRF